MKGTQLVFRGLLVLLPALGAGVATGPAQAPTGIADARSRSQVLPLQGLRQPVEILLDLWGVPHIFAANEDDLFFAQGFNAARDRLFQLDLWRRRGLGLLSEALGSAYVEQDRAARLFLYRGPISEEWRAYNPGNPGRVERVVRSFTSGINAFIDYTASHPENLPWEFRQFGYLPARWAPDDVVRIRSHGLTRNLLSEIARARTACVAGVGADEVRTGLQPPWETSVPDRLDACLPGDLARVFQLATQAVRVAGPERVSGTSLIQALRADDWAESAPAAEGSNNWVVAPAKSATGRAIMANDPHRAYSAPSLRYIVHLSAPGLNVIGAGEPVLPGISIGHNGTIAFGLTIFPIDQEDLYAYQLHATDPHLYRYRDGWEPFHVVREEVRVKGGRSVPVELLFTRHGPVIEIEREKGRAYALRSCWFEPGMSAYFCSVESMRAHSFPEFKEAMSRWGAPTLNHVYADVEGNIAWLPRGMAPKRDNWDGLLPVPGDGRYEWNGFWRAEELPLVYNPPQGWWATANQMNLPDGYPYRERKLGFEWTDPSRFTRESEVLSSMKTVSLEDSLRLQNDVLSIPARRLVAILAKLQPEDPKSRAALALFRNWDFRETQESAAAALFEVWLTHHLKGAYRKAVLPAAAAAEIASTDMRVMLEYFEKPSRRFGAQAPTERDALLLTTLAAAYKELESLQGPDPGRWQWGRLQYNLVEHAFSEAVGKETRARINVGPFPKNGSEFTPNQSLYRAGDFRQSNGPSFRIVVDVGNWDGSWAVNYPGQSGDPANPHYRDLAPLWLEGKYFPLLYSRSAIERETELRLRLVPPEPTGIK